VQQEAVGELGVAGLAWRDRAREQQADRVDALDVRAGVAVLRLDRGGERADGVRSSSRARRSSRPKLSRTSFA
jgi:hypothetical protein